MVYMVNFNAIKSIAIFGNFVLMRYIFFKFKFKLLLILESC